MLVLIVTEVADVTWWILAKCVCGTSWENLFMSYANSKCADQLAHPRSLISTFVIHCLDNIIPVLAIAEISRPLLVSSAEQAGLSLPWSPKTGFLVRRLIYLFINNKNHSCPITQFRNKTAWKNRHIHTGWYLKTNHSDSPLVCMYGCSL